MDKLARKKMVVAMEFIARALNDENDLFAWLTYGVADGDIPDGSLNPDDVDEYYIENDNFSELMACFLNRMASAKINGGSLYMDKIMAINEVEK